MAYQLERHQRQARKPVLPPQPDHRRLRWLGRLIAGLSARAMLRRLLRRRPVQNIAELPPHLLSDIGLPQDFHSHDGVAHLHPPV